MRCAVKGFREFKHLQGVLYSVSARHQLFYSVSSWVSQLRLLLNSRWLSVRMLSLSLWAISLLTIACSSNLLQLHVQDTGRLLLALYLSPFLNTVQTVAVPHSSWISPRVRHFWKIMQRKGAHWSFFQPPSWNAVLTEALLGLSCLRRLIITGVSISMYSRTML